MSGLETVKIIVDAEKEASNLLAQAEAKALQIKKDLDSHIFKEREEKLSAAREKAAAIIQKAEAEGKSEALRYAKESETRVRELIQRASARKTLTVKTLCELVLK
jgi:vacuolar-type H+-ATPase subunit H